MKQASSHCLGVASRSRSCESLGLQPLGLKAHLLGLSDVKRRSRPIRKTAEDFRSFPAGFLVRLSLVLMITQNALASSYPSPFQLMDQQLPSAGCARLKESKLDAVNAVGGKIGHPIKSHAF